MCATILTKFYEEEILIWDSEEEECNKEDFTTFLVAVADHSYDELMESTVINFVNEGSEIWN